MDRSRPPAALLALLIAAFATAPAHAAQAAHAAQGAKSARAPQALLDVLDFEGHPTGTIISQVQGLYGLGPVGVHATRPALGATNAALAFDSAAPIRGEHDLGTPHADFGGPGIGAGGALGSSHENRRAQRGVLVCAESLSDADGDGRVDHPGGADGAPGALIELDFSSVGPVVISGLTVLDVESGPVSIVLTAANGSPLAVVDVPLTGDNGAAWVDLGQRRGVHGMRVHFAGSGAIDDVVFRRDAAGLVESSVWYDADGDGLRSQDEPGLSGVRVLLENAHGVPLAETTTRWDGGLRFADLAAGTYLLEIDRSTLPASFADAPCDIGGDDAIDSDCSPALVTLVVNDQHVNDISFGLISACGGGLGNRVWFDEDGDGLQDPSEPGIQGVVVRLIDSQGSMVAEQVSGPDGLYEFLGLCADTYTVTVDAATLPPFYVASPCEVGDDDTIDSNCAPVTITIPLTHAADLTIDFGFASPYEGRIGDFMWRDGDCDGFQDGPLISLNGQPLDLEPGIPGGRIILRDDMGVIIGETSTNPDGEYAFVGLPEGRYTLEIDSTSLPPGLVPSFCNPGLDDTRDNDCSGAEVVLLGAMTDGGAVTVIFDFGFREEPCGGFACGASYWKQNTEAWPAPFAPEQLFSDVFNTVYLPGQTLLDVLCTTSGGAYAFAREAVAALLNSAASPAIAYALEPEQVDEVFAGAFAGQIDEVERRTEYLVFLNEQNCPLR